jgi:hypothetical protein
MAPAELFRFMSAADDSGECDKSVPNTAKFAPIAPRKMQPSESNSETSCKALALQSILGFTASTEAAVSTSPGRPA